MLKTSNQSLSSLLQPESEGLKLERNFLKDRVVEALRGYISTGRLPEGTKLAERAISEMLGISRMPVHEALIILETEGLVVRRGNARYVITLNEKEVNDLHFIRRELEIIATKLAASNITAEKESLLWASCTALEHAISGGDHLQIAKFDLALHRAIWISANNTYLQGFLNSLMGMIYVLNDRVQANVPDEYQTTLEDHLNIVKLIISGDGQAASEAMASHLDNAHSASLQTYNKKEIQTVEE